MAAKMENGTTGHDGTAEQDTKTNPGQGHPGPKVKGISFRQKMSSWRWLLAWITWFGFVNATLMRNSFNMALVCMTGSDPASKTEMNTTSTDNSTAPDRSKGEFDWDEQTQGIILSSVLYFGFLAPAISGVLSKKFGAKKIVGISMAICSVMNILTPYGARIHLYALIAMRVVIGCFSGTILPSTQCLWAHWAPDEEKVQLVSWTLSGVNIGSLVSSLISGFLCTIPVDNGWPFVFYVFGGISAVWCVVWWVLIYDTPEEHKWVSEAEKEYIKAHIADKPDNSTFIPYKEVITSVPMWAFVFIQSIHMWCATIFFTYLPKYMRDILRFPIEQNAIVSSVPFATRFIGVIFWGILADQLTKRHVSTTVNRKVIQSAGFLTCAALTVGIGFISEDQRVYAVVLFMITMFFQSSTFAASSIVPLDMAPRLASVISGVFLGAGGFMAIFAPIAVSSLTPDGTLEEWRNVFYMIIACYVAGVTVFVVFGSAELQPWGRSPPADNIVTEPTTNLEEPGKSSIEERPNGNVSNNDVIKIRPRVLIEREISIISTDSFKSHKSIAQGSPVVKIKESYFLEDEQNEGVINKGYEDDDDEVFADSDRTVPRLRKVLDDVTMDKPEDAAPTLHHAADEITRL